MSRTKVPTRTVSVTRGNGGQGGQRFPQRDDLVIGERD
jgi:hypothetical protein